MQGIPRLMFCEPNSLVNHVCLHIKQSTNNESEIDSNTITSYPHFIVYTASFSGTEIVVFMQYDVLFIFEQSLGDSSVANQ